MHRGFSQARALVVAGALILVGLSGPAAAEEQGHAEVAAKPDLSGPPPRLTPGVFSLRTYKVKKGSFEEMLRLSQQIIWPFYEKLGARNVAFWLEVPAPGEDFSGRDYDVIHMITHYESVAHWEMTRRPWAAGEDDAAFLRMANAMFRRYEMTLGETHVLAEGYLAGSAPSLVAASSDWPLSDMGAYIKVCSQEAGAAFKSWKPGAADAYCQCFQKEMGSDPGGWGRAYHVAWMRSGGHAKPETTWPKVAAHHAACLPQ